jgi:hypothetical protein
MVFNLFYYFEFSVFQKLLAKGFYFNLGIASFKINYKSIDVNY